MTLRAREIKKYAKTQKTPQALAEFLQSDFTLYGETPGSVSAVLHPAAEVGVKDEHNG